MTQEEFTKQWWEGFEEFKASHPDMPVAKEIPVLNLIMKKSEALEILSGRKKVEIRTYSKHYYDRMYDKNVLAYIDKHSEDEDVVSEIGNFVHPLRVVQRIHFHNYNNTWFLDVDVELNEVASLVEEDIAFLRDTYGFHDLDEQVAAMEAAKETRRPLFFYYVLGDIVDTNLR